MANFIPKPETEPRNNGRRTEEHWGTIPPTGQNIIAFIGSTGKQSSRLFCAINYFASMTGLKKD